MNPPLNTFWSVENVEILRDLRQRGLSGQAIAAEMHITRSSAIGKLARLGIAAPFVTAAPKKPKPPKAPKVPRAPKAVVIQFSKSTAPMTIPAAPPTQNSKPVSILDAKPWQCRSVLDQRDQRGRHSLAMYCGDVQFAGSSYCAFHFALYRRPPKEISNGQTSTYQ